MLTRPASASSLAALLLVTPAYADPGLGSLEGLWIVYLVGLVLLLTGLLVFLLLVRTGIRLLRSADPEGARTGRLLLISLGVIALLISTGFTDYSLYLLRDNTHADATEITRAHVERYMETADGRAFYLTDTGLHYFKPGRPVVLRTNAQGQARVFDVFEASRSMYHRLSDKKLWIPIIPTMRDRYGLEDRGPVVLLGADWRYDDLAAGIGDTPIAWCCDAGWIRLLLERGANPNAPTGGALPLYLAVHPIGWHHDEATIAAIEDGLAQMLAGGVDVNAMNANGDTALHQITANPFERSIEWLLAHGADPTRTNANGETPVDLMLEQEQRFGRYWRDDKRDEHRALIRMMARGDTHHDGR